MVFLLVPASLVLTISTPFAQDESRALFGKVVPALLEEHAVPGAAVALVRGGEVAWAEGFGMADVAAKRPVTADTIFNIGSIFPEFDQPAAPGGAVAAYRAVKRNSFHFD